MRTKVTNTLAYFIAINSLRRDKTVAYCYETFFLLNLRKKVLYLGPAEILKFKDLLASYRLAPSL
jgi:hypothetical protein